MYQALLAFLYCMQTMKRRAGAWKRSYIRGILSHFLLVACDKAQDGAIINTTKTGRRYVFCVKYISLVLYGTYQIEIADLYQLKSFCQPFQLPSSGIFHSCIGLVSRLIVQETAIFLMAWKRDYPHIVCIVHPAVCYEAFLCILSTF